MLLNCIRSYSHCDRKVALYLNTTFEMQEALDELDFYQAFVLDLKVLQRYRDELAVTKFLSGLDTSLGNQV